MTTDCRLDWLHTERSSEFAHISLQFTPLNWFKCDSNLFWSENSKMILCVTIVSPSILFSSKTNSCFSDSKLFKAEKKMNFFEGFEFSEKAFENESHFRACWKFESFCMKNFKSKARELVAHTQLIIYRCVVDTCRIGLEHLLYGIATCCLLQMTCHLSFSPKMSCIDWHMHSYSGFLWFSSSFHKL